MNRWLVAQCFATKVFGLSLAAFSQWSPVGWFLFFATDLRLAFHLFLPRSQGLCETITRFIPNGREIWLTIDDGPDPADSPRILDLLDEYGARATFFMIGENAQARPDLVRQAIDRGHTIGNHTHSHPLRDFWIAGGNRLHRELAQAQDAIRLAGATPRLFRSPAGIKNISLKRCLAALELRYVGWTIRSGDTYASTPEHVSERVLREVSPGSIILMHEGGSVPETIRVESIRAVLEGLRNEGYRCIIPKEDSLIA